MRRRHDRERGSVLVLFALLAFGFLAVLTLVVEMGSVLLARRQMQTAVNSASADAIRFRDELPSDRDLLALGESPVTPPDADKARRQMAAWTVRSTYDADFDHGNIDPANSMGAGPEVSLDGGQDIGGGLRASAQITGSSVYRPNPALNLGNLVGGDMVEGSYLGGSDHRENPDYSRADFAAGSDAFLVRLRRTDEDFSGQSESHTAGSAVPFLFGRGAIARAESGDPQALLARRARGTRVRATAITQARAALSVGVHGFGQDLSSERGGLLPVLVTRSTWLTWAALADADRARTVTEVGTGFQTDDGLTFSALVLSSPCDAERDVRVVGDAAITSFPLELVLPPSAVSGVYRGFCAIGARVDTELRIVGLAPLTLTLAGPVGDLTITSIIQDSTRVAPFNATSTFLRVCQLDGISTSNLMARVEGLEGEVTSYPVVLAPAKVRSIR